MAADGGAMGGPAGAAAGAGGTAASRVAIVVLAAGGSTRLGSPKQLERHGGRSLLRHAVETALAAVGPAAERAAAGVGAPVAPVVVVVGAEPERMRAELEGLGVAVAENAAWREGLAGSIGVGLDAVEACGGAGAALFTTCDQPSVASSHLAAMIVAHVVSRARVVASAYAGTIGVPALFGRELFAELRGLRGDAGAKAVIERHRREVIAIPCPGAAHDVDTAEDAARLRAGASEGPA